VAETISCFLLTRQWRDTGDGLELVFWGTSDRGPVRAVVRDAQAVCFIARDTPVDVAALRRAGATRRPLELHTLAGEAVDGLYFAAQRDLVAARDTLHREGRRLYESDVKPAERYLMERFVTAAFTARGEVLEREGYLELVDPAIKRASLRPRLLQVSIDIETDGLAGALYSIAVASPPDARVFMVAGEAVDAGNVPVVHCPDERALLEAFFRWLEETDPDLILGWNVVAFDLDFLERRCRDLGVPFALGRGGERAAVLRPQGPGGTHVARVPGRMVLDGIELLRAAFWSFESFELDAVAQALLGRGKHDLGGGDKVAEIRRLYEEDKGRLARYNLEDCRLVADIFAETGLVEFAVRRAELTGLALDRLGGSVAAFDNLYLPRLHRRGRVAGDIGDAAAGPPSPGGYVMDSRPGLYDNVLVLDFKSLYPSIIRTFKIDPLGLACPGEDPVPGFLDAEFARDGAILPELIAELWDARDEAKRRRDGPLAQAVKILMNSFYGVLGSPGCRFYDPRLASSITRRGHEIIRTSRDFIEDRGRSVIYGDTDSLFVLLGADVDAESARTIGEDLARALNDYWRGRLATEHGLESFLEIQFETHYLRFLMPTIRGEHTGSKKRYAGLATRPDGRREVVFKGLESVRTDWTPLARRFQRELYRRIFLDEPYEDYVRETLARLLDGNLDEELVYRKRLRRRLDEYARNAPPHVQAARKLRHPERWVRYVITASGPEPVGDGPLPRPDYEHYRERQLAPAANGILHFLDTSFEAITDAQLAIF